MNCSVCGAQLERGRDFCPNCGTKVNEMPGGGKGSSFGIHNQQMQASQYQNELNFTKDYNNVMTKSRGEGGSKVGGIVALILVLLAAACAAGWWFFIRPMQTKVFEFDKFSIEMPKTMEQGEGAEDVFGSISSINQGGIALDGDAYENDDVVFAFLSIDYTNYQEVQTGGMTMDNLSPETMISLMEEGFKTRSDFELVSSGSDYIKVKYKTAEGNLTYMNLSVKKKDKTILMIAMGCRAKDMDKYQAKVDKWMGTITLK